ncbi:signal recognition particle-docking protein FtsY [Hoeflea sp. IMCC20628]|uniref:signal recognition particle-docking protein FtsY n=1 Tax=Hoeflea sp. IMCC20628 TaxID=1620421 RepID=UPI00063AD65B|nr:signal recognition particle-docking protein FtsY [Hoeflea sp. IMCC20628]AKI03020.1 signal recognition particle-docking protein FtsY [Hoeflea sp. IMCC20628]
MALSFIKKVFSFGRNKEVAPDPAAEPAPDSAAETAPEAASEPEAPLASATPAAAPEQSFPHDGGEMQFTPETAVADELSPPAPADKEHAGEPPIHADPVEEGPEDGLTPEELSADPVLAPVPDETPEPASQDTASKALPQDGGGMQVTPEMAATDELPPAAPVDKDHATEAPIHAEPVEEGPEDGLTPEELSADPAVPPVPDETPEPTQEPAQRSVVVRDTVSPLEPVVAPEPVAEEKSNWWQRLRQGLSRTSGQLTGQISGIFTKRKLDDDTLEELEDILLQADLGVETAMKITGVLSATRYGKDISPAEVEKVMAEEITRVLEPVARPLELDLSHKPHVILVVGVNGTGKTTTIGKLAAKLSSGGLKVMLAAGDTFRAAAIEQLKIWGDRTGSKVVSTKLGADAAGLAYEAFESARTDGADVLIIDTAGRLQNRTELMDELAKVVRVIKKLDPDAPHTVLQTLDATTGQNALGQVEIFRNVAGVNGLVMTKLDGTARGGILVAIAAKHKLPVYFVGVGEGVDDLEPFEAADFASAIAGQPTGEVK